VIGLLLQDTEVPEDFGWEPPAEVVGTASEGFPGIAAWLMTGTGLAVLFALYVYCCLTLHLIARKTNTPRAWLAWIPIAQIVLLLLIAEKPLWWLILLLIPGVNIIFVILVWMSIVRRRGKPGWLGALLIIPPVNLAILGYLAFSR